MSFGEKLQALLKEMGPPEAKRTTRAGQSPTPKGMRRRQKTIPAQGHRRLHNACVTFPVS